MVDPYYWYFVSGSRCSRGLITREEWPLAGRSELIAALPSDPDAAFEMLREALTPGDWVKPEYREPPHTVEPLKPAEWCLDGWGNMFFAILLDERLVLRSGSRSFHAYHLDEFAEIQHAAYLEDIDRQDDRLILTEERDWTEPNSGLPVTLWKIQGRHQFASGPLSNAGLVLLSLPRPDDVLPARPQPDVGKKDFCVGCYRAIVKGKRGKVWIIEVSEFKLIIPYEPLPGWVGEPDQPEWISIGAEIWVSFWEGNIDKPFPVLQKNKEA